MQDKLMKNPQPIEKNKISLKYTKQAMDEDFKRALVELKIEGDILNMNEFKTIMNILGYSSRGNPNSGLLQDAWEVMQGDEKGFIQS